MSCQKKIWQDDIEALLTNFTKKNWVRYDSVSRSYISRIYYYDTYKTFKDNTGDSGLWFIPENGVIKETLFKKNGDIKMNTYDLISVTGDQFKRKEKGNDQCETFIHP